MKKRMLSVLLIFCIILPLTFITASADDDNWKEKPVFTDVYEIDENMLQLKWKGGSNAYKVILDGKELRPFKGGNQIKLEIKKAGTHRMSIIPIKFVSLTDDGDFSLEIPYIGGSASWNWKSLGIDPKDVLEGEQSEELEFSYTPSKLFKAKPEIVSKDTDFDDNVIITFKDLYDADAYRIYIKSGKNDERYYEFDAASEETAKYVEKKDTIVTIKLDKDYLREKRWMVPSLNEKYSFSAQLVKYPENLLNSKSQKEIEVSSPLYSERSKEEEYTPTARWKKAPEITYESQSGEDTVSVTWEHDDNGLGCEYKILRYEKIAGIKKGETEIGKTSKQEYIIKDLMNGKYTFAVVPVLGKEDGEAAEFAVEIKPDWVIAPKLECSVEEDSKVELEWEASPKVETYHITVYEGSGSLLRFVNLDFKKLDEFDVPAEDGEMEFEYVYPNKIDPDTGVRLRFEIYGSRHAADNSEQTSSTSKQTIVLK